MHAAIHISGYAVISEDGMIANAEGVMPEALKLDADQRFFERGLDQADVLVHGRHSQESYPNSSTKPRLILTRQAPAIAAHPSNPKALLWNPAGAPFLQALAALGTPHSKIGVIGGGDVFELFLNCYEAFYLSRVSNVQLPGGRPVFQAARTQLPEHVLEAHGLERGPTELSAQNLTIIRWQRGALSARAPGDGSQTSTAT